MTNTRRAGILLALTTATISGFSVFLNSFGVRAYADASAYTTAKNAAAGALLVGFAVVAVVAARRVGTAARRVGTAASGRRRRPRGAPEWLGLGAIAVFGGAVPFLLFFNGLASTESTQAAVLHKSLVIWVAILAVVFLKERMSWLHWAAIAGIVVAQLALAGGVDALAGLVADPGTLMVLGATLMWSIEVAWAKRLLGSVAPETVSVARMAGGAAVLLAWAGLRGELAAVVPHTAVEWMWVAVTGVLLAGYVSTWHHALARAQAVDVTAVLTLGVLITAGLSAAVRGAAVGADLPWCALLGGAAGALAWSAARSRRPAAPAQPPIPAM